MKKKANELSGWTFEVDEVSAGAYKVRGVDKAGRSVEATGGDPDTLLDECKKTAARIAHLIPIKKNKQQ